MANLRTIVLLVACLLSGTASASDAWATFGFLSLHDGGHYNETNEGIGGEVVLSDSLRLVAGYYVNSQWRDSVYAGGAIMPARIADGVAGGVVFGAVTGYEHHSVTPIILPTVSFEGDLLGLNVSMLPPSVAGPSVLAFQFKLRI